MKTEQDLFEDAAYALYQQKRTAGTLPPDDGDGSRESLFWKQENGEYGVLMFNAAWWGWQARAESVGNLRELAAEYIAEDEACTSSINMLMALGRKIADRITAAPRTPPKED